MGMLDRYKKKGGFFQLLQLIETSPKAKQEQFLQLIAAESPVWEEAIRQRVLSIEKVYSWSPEVLAEIFSRTQPLQLATALHGLPPAEIERLTSVLPPISKRRLLEVLAEAKPTAGEKANCINKILGDVRTFIAQGILKAEKIDANLAIPDDIEEKLANTSSSISLAEIEQLKAEVSARANLAAQAVGGSSGGDSSAVQQEIEFLKKKVSQLLNEVNALKSENLQLKDKLAQIRKIA